MKPTIIEKNFDQLLTEVQEAFANREKGLMGIGHKQSSGEKAIAEYFKTLGIEIDLKNESLVGIASTDRKITQENLQMLLGNLGVATQDQKEAQEEISSLMSIDIVSGNTKKTHEERSAARLEPNAMNTVALYNKQTRGVDNATPTAQNLIIDVYNKCVTDKTMTADDFAIKLFGDTFKNTPEMKKLTEQSKEVFSALHSQYGKHEIKDNLAKVEKDLTSWEKIKDFISNLLSFVVDMGTNAGDKEKYKANKMEPKSLLEHAAKNPSGKQLGS